MSMYSIIKCTQDNYENILILGFTGDGCNLLSFPDKYIFENDTGHEDFHNLEVAVQYAKALLNMKSDDYHLRIGISIGDITAFYFDGRLEYCGIPLHLATRLQSSADSDSISISKEAMNNLSRVNSDEKIGFDKYHLDAKGFSRHIYLIIFII
jgi:class 3 adenylate cyclase